MRPEVSLRVFNLRVEDGFSRYIKKLVDTILGLMLADTERV